MFEFAPRGVEAHLLVLAKSAIVLVSWVFGYMGIKHLPLTIVGPVNATRPVMVLLGAMLLFGERLNGYQWTGVGLALLSLLLLSRSGRREGIDFAHNVWIVCLALAAVAGAASGLYDKYVVRRLDPVFVQSWYNLYQAAMMAVAVALLRRPRRPGAAPVRWSWAILLISLFLSLADFAYLMALRDGEAMISVVSMIRRGSVVVSFCCGALLFRERNLRAKALDLLPFGRLYLNTALMIFLLFILIGMIFLYLGSKP